MADYIRVGFLGASSIAHKAWKAIEKAGSIHVTAVACRDKARGEAFVKECVAALGVPEERVPAVVSYDELVTSPNVDVIYISIPVTARNEWVLKCVENGKHIVGEKPPAASSDELRSWLEALSAKKLLYVDGTMFSHGPYIEKVLECLPQVGAIKQMTSNFSTDLRPESNDIRLDPALEPLGALGDVGWYCVRAMLHVMRFKMPVAVSGRIVEQSAKGGITSFFGELTFEDGETGEAIIGSFYCDFNSTLDTDFTVAGTDAVIEAPNLFMPTTDKPVTVKVVKTDMSCPVPQMSFTCFREVREVEVKEDGHVQETNLWRNVRDAMRKGSEEGKYEVDEGANVEWGKRAWMTQCILEKLLESAKVQ